MNYLLFKKRLEQASDFHQEYHPDDYADESFKEGAEWARKYILEHEIKDFEAKYKQQSEALASVNRKLDKLKSLLLLTDDALSDVVMNDLTMRQWSEFIKEFPDEREIDYEKK